MSLALRVSRGGERGRGLKEQARVRYNCTHIHILVDRRNILNFSIRCYRNILNRQLTVSYALDESFRKSRSREIENRGRGGGGGKKNRVSKRRPHLERLERKRSREWGEGKGRDEIARGKANASIS